MSDREVNEIADTPPGVTLDLANRLEAQRQKSDYERAAQEAVSEAPVAPSRTVPELTSDLKGVSQSVATVRGDKVEFERTDKQEKQ